MKELQKTGYICHPQQMYTVRRMTVAEGKAKGTDIIEVSTAGGLQVDILPDAGLDIGQVRYKGSNVTFISKNGYDSPAAIDPYELEFLNTFPGGLLYTCGLRTTVALTGMETSGRPSTAESTACRRNQYPSGKRMTASSFREQFGKQPSSDTIWN